MTQLKVVFGNAFRTRRPRIFGLLLHRPPELCCLRGSQGGDGVTNALVRDVGQRAYLPGRHSFFCSQYESGKK